MEVEAEAEVALEVEVEVAGRASPEDGLGGVNAVLAARLSAAIVTRSIITHTLARPTSPPCRLFIAYVSLFKWFIE